MSLPKPPFQGACLCESVQVRVTAPPLLTVACHCRDCQKFTASAYSLTTMFPSAAFSCTGELVTGGLGRNGRTHYFCASCLNFVYSQIEGANHRINLRTSILSNAGMFVPFMEMMTTEKMPWAHVPVVHSYSSFPKTAKELQALMDEYAQS